MTVTLVISDLHLGMRSEADLLRRPDVREALLAALDGVDRLVILGDAIELRDGPVRPVLDVARPFFEALGAALGDREVVITPGNHDHQLAGGWLDRRHIAEDAAPLALEQVIAPREASELAEVVNSWLGPATLRIAYPGLWLADGVYATHGHYLDRHVTTPSFERLGARLVERIVHGAARAPGVPEDYERALAPIYALLYAAAQGAAGGGTGAAGASARAWGKLVGEGSRRPSAWGRLLGAVGVPVVVGALNRAGLGPLRAQLSAGELRRAGLRAMAEVVRALGIDARHVIFGHTHRGGPFPGDDAEEWALPRGGRLVNTGCWVFESLFVTSTPNGSPYWPGTAVRVEKGGEPELRRLLGDRSHAELNPRAPAPA